jgi:protein SCO1
LLSISIDPAYDQPAVLRAFGLEFSGSPHPFGQWEFASGTPQQVQKVAGFFGLKYWTDNGQIVHALVTTLIGPDGRVVKLYQGNDWLPADVLADLRALRHA